MNKKYETIGICLSVRRINLEKNNVNLPHHSSAIPPQQTTDPYSF